MTTATVRPRLIIFDVNETLSDLSPMAERFAEVGLPATLAATWFAGVLRDGFALTVTGENPAFAELAKTSLRAHLGGRRGGGFGEAAGASNEAPAPDVEQAVAHVMNGFMELPVHPDVVDGVRALADLGLRLVTLSNGSAGVARALLERNGIDEVFERLLTVEDAPAWKPAGSAYSYALETCEVSASEAMLVAVHPWDIHGAHAAGLSTAWIDRSGAPYPSTMHPADLEVDSVTTLTARLSAWPADNRPLSLGGAS